MPKFILTGKYTPQSLAAVRKDGYASRVASTKRLAESIGGTYECMYFLQGGEWDFFAIIDCSSEAVFALGSMAGASGVFEGADVRELRTGEEADSIIASDLSWTPPGQGSS